MENSNDVTLSNEQLTDSPEENLNKVDKPEILGDILKEWAEEE